MGVLVVELVEVVPETVHVELELVQVQVLVVVGVEIELLEDQLRVEDVVVQLDDDGPTGHAPQC